MKENYETIELPDLKGCENILREIFEQPEAQPKAIGEQFKVGMELQGETKNLTSVRAATYKGHTIDIKTTYEILIDNKPLSVPVSVDEIGHLHCHSIPYKSYSSAMDFVKNVIDIYPDTFSSRSAKS